mmetsp:Transcript_3968/g.16157  ORF Transcript_3968/g.16157 Transcript_3968/m.16157 type:complete len:207 (+) Transcript_3968:933-1553(+)
MDHSAGFDRVVRAPRARLRAVRRRVRDRGWGERGASAAQPGTARFGRVARLGAGFDSEGAGDDAQLWRPCVGGQTRMRGGGRRADVHGGEREGARGGAARGCARRGGARAAGAGDALRTKSIRRFIRRRRRGKVADARVARRPRRQLLRAGGEGRGGRRVRRVGGARAVLGGGGGGGEGEGGWIQNRDGTSPIPRRRRLPSPRILR